MADSSGTPKSGLGIGYVIVIGLLVVTLVVVASIAGISYKQAHDCDNDPNIRCFNDYRCPYSIMPGATAPEMVCPDGFPQTSTWLGVTGIYAPLANVCRFGPTGPGGPSGPPAQYGCTCAWTGAGGT